MSQDIPVKEDSAIILPQFITLSDKGGYYLTIDSSNSLICNKHEPDDNCTFEVIHQSDGSIYLKGANGKIVNLYYWAWFRCEGDGGGCHFNIIHLKGNQIYLQSTQNSVFMTNRQHPKNYGIAGSSYAGEDCIFTVSEPIISKEIDDVVYDLPKALMWDVPPIIALNTTVRNDSHTSDVVETLAYSYTRSKVGTWNNVAGIEIGAETSFSAGVPFIASADFTLSVTASYSHEWGGSEGTEETISSSTQITVPAGKKGKATVLVKNKAIDVSFTCKEKITYRDGKTKINDKEGVYNNVESYTVDVQAGDWEDA